MLVNNVWAPSVLFVCCLAPVARGEQPEALSAEEWAQLRSAHEASCHAVHRVEGGFEAENPEQRWTTFFDGRGFRTEPDSGTWSWGLELERYGFVGAEREVGDTAQVHAEGERVVYDWGGSLEEWYVNDSRGLEHGYTLHRRPPLGSAEEGAPVSFTFAVRGALRPELVSGGRDVHFVDEDGTTVVTYTGLLVLGADDQELPAHFEVDGTRLLLRVDERGARYPLTIDPLAQQAYLKASNTDADDAFGQVAAISGDTVVIGAPGEASAATGVNGDQADDSANQAGAAYVFVRNGSSWSQQAYLKASNTDAGDWFGHSVAISGDTVVVGAFHEASGATGVNGDQNDDSAPSAGAAYVFVRNGSSWAQEAYLKAFSTDADDLFGNSVSISGDTVLVGAPKEDSGATGVNGDQNDNGAGDSGAVYVFGRTGSTWSQQAYLKASTTDAGDWFGYSVAISDDTVIVGANGEDSLATGVGGDENDNSADWAGAAYVFVRDASTWSQEAYLKASNTDQWDEFGSAVAISADTAIVAARVESSSATGIDGDESDNSAFFAGAAYVFGRSGTTWSQEAYLKASNTDAGDQFGHSVAISGDAVVVGAHKEMSSAKGVNGDETDNSASAAGAAYVFLRVGTKWFHEAYLKASNTGQWDSFGSGVAISGYTIVVGADQEASSATGVGGDENDDSALFAGAAYTFAGPGVLTTAINPANGHTYHLLEHSGWMEAEIVARTLGGHLVAIGDQAENDWVVATFDWYPPGSVNDLLIGANDLESEGWFVWTNGDPVIYWDWAPGQPNGGVVEDVSMIRIATGMGQWHDYDGVDIPERHGVVEVVTEPGVGYCFGDPGSGTACPCSNDNDGNVPGSGCANGAFASGARLTGSGTASISNDTLVLSATGLDPLNSGLYFQADNDLTPGFIWGDGLQCAGGQLKRLGVRFSDATGASDTSAWTTPISVWAGNVLAGDTKRYQLWYRDTSGGQPCGVGVNDFNATNGYEITWLP